MVRLQELLPAILFSRTIISCGSRDDGGPSSSDETSSTSTDSLNYNSTTFSTVVFGTSIFE